MSIWTPTRRLIKPRPNARPTTYRGKRHMAGAWLFSDTPKVTGETIDYSGNGNHGTLVNQVNSASGRFGNALQWDGVGDNLTIPHSSSLVSDYFSYVAWVKVLGAHDDDFGAIWFDQAISNRSRIMINNDGAVWTQLRIGAVDDSFASTAGDVPSGEWCQIVVTHDGTNQYVYVNAIQVATDNHAGTLDASSSVRWIGIGQAPTTFAFNGLIDHVIYYNRALSAGEVASLYADPFQDWRPEPIELWSDKTVAAPAGNAGIMTTNTGYWGATY